MIRSLDILWRFSRPHTIIGSTISITALYVIACGHHGLLNNLHLWVLGVLTAIGCNIFIVGINQIEDVRIDVINKPYLPVASGELTVRGARWIVIVAASVSLLISVFISLYLFIVIVLSLLIGVAYSLPPLHLKRHHLPAALAITIVRGLIVNIGGFIAFNQLINRSTDLPQDIRILTIFIIAFSIAIAWFKDLPDMSGDAQYNIRTLAILYSPRVALISGSAIVISAFLYSILMKGIELNGGALPQTIPLLAGNITLLSLFIWQIFSLDLADPSSVRKFYRRFWVFFFLEYGLYLWAYL